MPKKIIDMSLRRRARGEGVKGRAERAVDYGSLRSAGRKAPKGKR